MRSDKGRLYIVLYILAYVAGGWDIATHAVPGLLRGKFDTDVLMLAAAAGAALLGEWAEGAFLLFLFGLGHAGTHWLAGLFRHHSWDCCGAGRSRQDRGTRAARQEHHAGRFGQPSGRGSGAGGPAAIWHSISASAACDLFLILSVALSLRRLLPPNSSCDLPLTSVGRPAMSELKRSTRRSSSGSTLYSTLVPLPYRSRSAGFCQATAIPKPK